MENSFCHICLHTVVSLILVFYVISQVFLSWKINWGIYCLTCVLCWLICWARAEQFMLLQMQFWFILLCNLIFLTTLLLYLHISKAIRTNYQALLTGLWEYYCVQYVKQCCTKQVVAPEWPAQSLKNCLKWCHLSIGWDWRLKWK